MQSDIALRSPVAGLLPVEVRAAFGEDAGGSRLRAARACAVVSACGAQVARAEHVASRTESGGARADVSGVRRGRADRPGVPGHRVADARSSPRAVARRARSVSVLLYRTGFQRDERFDLPRATRGLVDTSSATESINRGIERIVANQNVGGAFGYWDRFDSVREEFQPYAVETLMLALPYATDRDAVTAAIDKDSGTSTRSRRPTCGPGSMPTDCSLARGTRSPVGRVTPSITSCGTACTKATVTPASGSTASASPIGSPTY